MSCSYTFRNPPGIVVFGLFAVHPTVPPGLCVLASRPVVFRYAGPEDPDHDYGEEGEEDLEEAAVYFAFCAVADVDGDYELEDLAKGEEEAGAGEVDWRSGG